MSLPKTDLALPLLLPPLLVADPSDRFLYRRKVGEAIKLVNRIIIIIVLGILFSTCRSTKDSVKSSSEHPADLESIFTVRYLTRELRIDEEYMYVQTTEHEEQINSAEAAEFFHAYPDLNGFILESDYRFLMLAIQDGQAFTLLMNRKRLFSLISEYLSESNHVYSQYSSIGGLTETPDQIYYLNILDQLKVFLLLDTLYKRGITAKIGGLLVADMLNTKTEYGGVVKYSPKSKQKIKLEFITSSSSSDSGYIPEGDVINPNHMAMWHNHAAYDFSVPLSEVDNSNIAGPSGKLSGSLLSSLGGDLWEYFINGIDGIVITPTGNRTFNLDFATSEGIVVDLGIFSYE